MKIWREKGFKNLDLVHVDAHIDFGFPAARPIKQVFNEAKDIKGLKRSLEQTLSFLRYEKDFDKQTNIGNYIYPAMSEGIVRDFYWVIPGGIKEFKESLKAIKKLLKNLSTRAPQQLTQRINPIIENGIISVRFLGRKFVICILENLPFFKHKVLIDIDTDFLVIDSFTNSSNVSMIGKRMPWILPGDLADVVGKKIKKPVFITIAYSINGGYTPIRYKHLGDELANSLSKGNSKDHYKYRENLLAAEYFNLFRSTRQKKYYQKAVKLNPSYRVADNNYGPLYLSIGRLSRAEKEFKKIAEVDKDNPYPFIGLGNIALRRREYNKAKRFFRYSLNRNKDLSNAIFGLGEAKFKLRQYRGAKRLFWKYQAKEPIEPRSYYFLGRIYQKENNLEKSLVQYQQAMRLGLENVDLIYRFVKIAVQLKARKNKIGFGILRYNEFMKQVNLKKNVKFKGLRGSEKKIAFLDRIAKNSNHRLKLN